MFDVQELGGERTHSVFAVHKSGPLDEQTKFLVHADGIWKWVWAVHYVPVSAAPSLQPLPEVLAADRSGTARILRGGRSRTA